MKRVFAGTLFILMAICADNALADGWPGSVVGTWRWTANQTSGTLTITSQASTGFCRRIVGTMTPLMSNIEGFYCPYSGRIHFLRKDPPSNDTFQSYVGNLSQNGTVNRIGGTFTQSVPNASLGEYSFMATK